jgi:hypothetical protein
MAVQEHDARLGSRRAWWPCSVTSQPTAMSNSSKPSNTQPVWQRLGVNSRCSAGPLDKVDAASFRQSLQLAQPAISEADRRAGQELPGRP